MSELRREGRALLAEAHRERTPDATARERVFAALMASEALASSTDALSAKVETEPEPLTGLGKWLLLAAFVAAVAASVYVAGHVGAKPPAAPALR